MSADDPKLPRAVQTRLLAGFRDLGALALSSHDVRDLLAYHRDEWGIPKALGPKVALDRLLAANQFREIAIASVGGRYAPITRYLQGEPSVFEIALSLAPRGYLSHGSALYVHELTQQIPATIYVNREQSEKAPPIDARSALSQEGIDRAFRAPQRRTNYVYQYGDVRIAILSGKHTGRLEVIEVDDGEFSGMPVTSIARTLIDIAVRPDYAGGVAQIVEAYERAKGRFSVNRLVATLRELDYVYPYHQAIGFYLARANYSGSALDELRSFGLNFDFPLAHGMKDAVLDPSWRVYRPEWL